MSALVRVVVIDDSPLSAEVLRSVIEEDPRLEVAAVGHDGLRAIELNRTLRPAVITMDVHMPRMNGLEAVSRIMATNPTRILLVTEDTAHGLPFEALRRGAMDLLRRPAARTAFGVIAGNELRQRILLLAQVPLLRPRGRIEPRPPVVAPARLPRSSALASRAPLAVLGVAASSGGPAALATFLTALGPTFPLPILIVQHLAAGFVGGLATWLERVSGLRTRVATDGARFSAGDVLLSPDDAHLGIDRPGHVRLDPGPPIDGHRPSATHLFSSLARIYGDTAAAVVLTGMGRDGAAGVRALAAAGARLFVQDERTSVVFGMPRAAAEADPSAELGAPEALAARISALASARVRVGA